MDAVFVDCTYELAAVLERLRLEVPASLRVNHGTPSQDELLTLCADAEVLLVEHTVLPETVVRAARRLRAVIFMGTGASTYVPLSVCAERGISVFTTPGYANRAVAEHAMALLFSAARDVSRMDRELRAGEWIPRGGLQLRGRKIAVVGLGEIGQTFAEMASALGMHVAGWNRTRVAVPYFVPDLDAALLGADVVSIHLALTEQTRSLIDAARLGLLAPGAILVNTARAQIVDASALEDALITGKLRHAGLDVFADEPLPSDHAWRDVQNVTLTAHAAYMTDEAYAELWAKALRTLRGIQSTS